MPKPEALTPPPALVRAGLETLPAIIREGAERASRRFIEFFTPISATAIPAPSELRDKQDGFRFFLEPQLADTLDGQVLDVEQTDDGPAMVLR